MDPLIGSAIIGAGTSAVQGAAGAITSGNLNRKNRKYNAEQAELNRQFQAQQAELGRDWVENFYNQYQSPQAIIRQGKDAGLHPYMALGVNPASGPSSQSLPSGSSANSGQQFNPSDSLQSSIRSMLDIMGLKSQIDLNNSLSKKYDADAELALSNTSVNSQNIKESQQRINESLARTDNEREKRGLIVAQKLLAETSSQLNSANVESISYDVLRKRFDEQFKQDYGVYPAKSLYESIWRVVQGIGESSFVKRLFFK